MRVFIAVRPDPALAKDHAAADLGAFPVASVLLMRSVLTSSGPIYSVLAEFPGQAS